MLALDSLKRVRDNSLLDLKLERDLNFLYKIYFICFILFTFVISFFCYVYVTQYISPKGVRIQLPHSSQKFFVPSGFDKLIIKLSADNQFYLNDDPQPVSGEMLPQKLKEMDVKSDNFQILLMFDRDVSYGNFVSVTNFLREMGYSNVALVTE